MFKKESYYWNVVSQRSLSVPITRGQNLVPSMTGTDKREGPIT